MPKRHGSDKFELILVVQMSIGRKWKEVIDITDKITYSFHVNVISYLSHEFGKKPIYSMALVNLVVLQDDSRRERSAKVRYNV